MLVAGLVFSFLLLFPLPSQADTNHCFDEHETCTERALAAKVGIIKTVLMLTVCDAALGVCLISNALKA